MDILFTKGVRGIIDENNKIKLYSDSKLIETHSKSMDDIEKEYNIKLLGVFNEDSKNSKKVKVEHNIDTFINYTRKVNSEYKFIINKDNSYISIDEILLDLDDKFVEIMNKIESNIMKNEYSLIGAMPQFITSEGLEIKFFISVEDFNRNISKLKKHLGKDVVFLNKLIYIYDLISLVKDIQQYSLNIYRTFMKCAINLSNIYKRVDFNDYLLNNDKYEYMFYGEECTEISSLYMTTIIQMASTLDIITKLLCEITNTPNEYEAPIKFKSGKIYFSDINKYENIFKKSKFFKNSLINKRDNYTNLILNRHLIAHNGFLSSNPCVIWGKGTHVVNNNNINYACMYIWDTDNNGRPVRWLNRGKFYSQENYIDDYLLNYIINFYDDLEKTLDLIEEYLIN